MKRWKLPCSTCFPMPLSLHPMEAPLPVQLVKPTDNTVTISIGDSGCGIRRGGTQIVYSKKFQQAAAGRTQKTGFGIGLYLVKHFVTSHQGTITVKVKNRRVRNLPLPCF